MDCCGMGWGYVRASTEGAVLQQAQIPRCLAVPAWRPAAHPRGRVLRELSGPLAPPAAHEVLSRTPRGAELGAQ